MPEREVRYPCPVCLGSMLAKLKPSPQVDLLLDACPRCGGIWFDEGEVDRLRRCRPKAFAQQVTVGPPAHRMKCHACHASMERNAARCPACRRENRLLCPTCGRGLKPVEHAGVKLDVCRHCRGAWFDNVELAAIWNRSAVALAARNRSGPPAGRDVVVDYFFLDAFLWAPDAAVHAVGSGVAAADAAVGAAGGLAEVGGALVEGTGDLAGAVFEAIASIVGELF